MISRVFLAWTLNFLAHCGASGFSRKEKTFYSLVSLLPTELVVVSIFIPEAGPV